MSDGAKGELKFSIEDLLYYAPRFTSAGQTLAAATDAAEKQLLGLGAFWGGSSPDRPFANGYEPGQYALLIIVKQLATELQGIGGGIELMAKNYAVTEADIQHDIDRIGAAAAHESALLRHSGDPAGPPDGPPSAAAAPAAPSTPSPTPQQPPSPVGGGDHSQRHAVSTPSPTPEVPPDPEAWKRRDATSLFGPWPTGKPDLMDEAAAAWKTLAGAIDTAWRDTQRNTAYVLSDNQGQAADAFQETVQGLIDPHNGSLTHALQACEQLQAACNSQAQAIRDLKHEFENLAAQLAATFAINLALAYFTFGAAEAAEAAIAEGILGQATRLAAILIRYSEELAKSIGNSIAKVFAKGITAGGTSLASAAVGLPISNAISEAFGQDPVEGKKGA